LIDALCDCLREYQQQVVDWTAIATAEIQGLMPSSGDPVTAENETGLPPTPQAIRWQCFLGAIEGMASQQTGSVQQCSTATSGSSTSKSSSSGSANGTLIRDALKDAGFLHRTVEFVMQVSVISDFPLLHICNLCAVLPSSGASLCDVILTVIVML
jgi:hypothetical protein